MLPSGIQRDHSSTRNDQAPRLEVRSWLERFLQALMRALGAVAV